MSPAPLHPGGSHPRRSRCRGRRAAQLLLVATGLAGLLLAVGFFLFVARIQTREATLDRDADGIVVLTGGSDRLVDATNLLAEGRGKRLLITGVHPETTLPEIARQMPAPETALQCCVDMGRSALNTRGNAIETAQWARAQGFHSLIVVTSTWHMPRALVELRRAAPELQFIPYSVVSPTLRTEPWWRSAATIRLMAVEYLKYLAAYAQIRPWPATTEEEKALAR